MTFEAFKREIIERIRKSEFNQFLFLYIKSKNWNDILKAFKFNGYYEWGFSNGIVDFDFLNEIPEEEREKENIYNRRLDLEDINGWVFLLNDGHLNLMQHKDYRCKIFMFGKSQFNVSSIENSMVDVEQYHASNSVINISDNSFLYCVQSNESVSDISAKGFSTIKMILNDNTISTINLYEDSFLDASTFWFSKLIVNRNKTTNNTFKQKEESPNFKIINKEKSQIILKNE